MTDLLEEIEIAYNTGYRNGHVIADIKLKVIRERINTFVTELYELADLQVRDGDVTESEYTRRFADHFKTIVEQEGD